MKISSKTKISELIKLNDKAIDAISSINKNFKKLKNPFLRKVLASRVKIEDAAKIGGVAVEVMLNKLQEIGFEVEEMIEKESNTNPLKLNKTLDMNKNKIVELDVRPILDKGVDPFKAIMDKLDNMDADETLMIINTFEPIPLLNILKTKGYVYETERPESGLVNTFIEKGDEQVVEMATKVEKPELSFEDMENRFSGKMTEIDVRHLEMPLPMVTILEELEKVGEGQALYVNHKRLPQYLLPELENRDYKLVSKEIDEHNTKLIIFK